MSAAAALPLFTLTFGVITLGMAVFSYSFVSSAARDAVRDAIVHGSASLSPATATDIQNYVLNNEHGLNTKDVSVSTNWKTANPKRRK